MDTERHLEIFRQVLFHANVSGLPDTLPSPYDDPVDDFWHLKLDEVFNDQSDDDIRLILNTAAVDDVPAEEFNIHPQNSRFRLNDLEFNDETTLYDLYMKWFRIEVTPKF